ncbi:alpha-amylase family glycosyl hydrolase [Alterisphingorhabdus coralli]|uniref:Alpha-amylase family glycosyl hydrolase n=1 Tax=Alterisphingorhabdus coralli TaxID=3071408 RepID=A0AA97F6Z0_9SPHN|nr:alpha-amylase family glycosyl hydrolase [Parasphingorhabdus sp. SCSIO 66989]WOE75519.1 alpha-amylase family glycosyl hydrolase [Parasphingorhabdus sp. SCSIO 66989]
MKKSFVSTLSPFWTRRAAQYGSALLGGALLAAAPVAAQDHVPTPPAQYGADASLAEVRARLPQDEIIYFVLPDRFANADPDNDRGGLTGGALKTGYDPTHKGFYHGGDLKGLIEKLDYIEDMGITAIWFAPIFTNKPVQGDPGEESAGYHGYWVTDFTKVDPHFGTNEDFKTFVEAAHARGMKVYMDIITNHTADVIVFRDGDENGYRYRSIADYPWSTKGDADGEPINDGFLGEKVLTEENFSRLTDPNFAYQPYVPAEEADVKRPAWLNNPIYYHNRGDTTFTGESSRMGDFVGLDDVMTEHPRVVAGFIEVYADWIRDFGVDGFRIDTARHVNPEFWQQFVPAMLQVAKEQGIPNFHIFGEVYSETADPGYLAQYSVRDGFPALLDFSFRAAMRETLKSDGATNNLFRHYAGDVLYAGGEKAALQLPTFLGNHDVARFSTVIKQDNPDISQEELLARVKLGHMMMLGLRGVPTIYSGTEQGFVGDGNDQAAREDMFPSKVDSYNDNDLIGTDATTAEDNFDQSHVLYQTVADFAKLRRDHPALRRGRQLPRANGDTPGLFAVSRFEPDTDREYVLVYNTSAEPVQGNVRMGYGVRQVESIYGDCASSVRAPGALAVSLPAFGALICAEVRDDGDAE